MQLYDITIGTTETRQLDAPGDYFYYYAGTAGGADATITLRGLSSGLRIILAPGQAFRLPQGQRETSWVMTNYAGAGAIVGRVVVGAGEITDNRITGSVEVIDGGKARTMIGSVFGWRSSIGSLAGNWNFHQIWNPPGSGKRLLVKYFSISGGGGVSGWNSAAIGAVGGAIGNKLAGGGAGVAITRNFQQASATLAGFNILNGAASGQQIEEPEPIVIPPGYGFVMASDGSAVSTVATAHFVEEPNV